MATANTSLQVRQNRVARLSGTKSLIERAAAFTRRTDSEFVINHVMVAAKDVIAEHDCLQLE